jgi:predicted histidine transporter YuiF (NhaC family)
MKMMKFINDKKLLYITGIIAGLGLLIAGGLIENKEQNRLSAVLTALGVALFGLCVGQLVTHIWNIRRVRKYPEIARAQNINQKDERNVLIRDKAGARTNTILVNTLFFITFIFALLNIEFFIIAVLAGLMLLDGIIYAVYTSYFNKTL